MTRIEVKYTAQEFVELHNGYGIQSAREYVAENPKEAYSTDDFAEVYRMEERKEKAKARFHYVEHQPDDCGSEYMEELVDLYETD